MYLSPVIPCEPRSALLSSATGVPSSRLSSTRMTETSSGSMRTASTRPTRMPLYLTGEPTSSPFSDTSESLIADHVVVAPLDELEPGQDHQAADEHGQPGGQEDAEPDLLCACDLGQA